MYLFDGFLVNEYIFITFQTLKDESLLTSFPFTFCKSLRMAGLNHLSEFVDFSNTDVVWLTTSSCTKLIPGI